MDGRTFETASDRCNSASPDNQMNFCMNSDSCAEQGERSSNSMDENNISTVSNENQEISDQEQNFPALQKILNLSTQVENLRKEYSVLADEVKGMTMEPFLGLEVHNTLRLLSNEYELLKKKYGEESSERKRLYNEVIELKGNIRVFCRCRPLNQDEIANGSTSVVDFDSCQEHELQIICSDSSKRQFKFDHVFRSKDTQEAVFAQTSPIVTSVLDGYNVCIFAYGQTGTGKTFTMEGTPENRGVNYRTLEELFRIYKERNGIMRYELFVSILEVYNEKIRDLLVEESSYQMAKKLEIKQAAEGTQEVPGLVEAPVHCTDEVWELLKSGSKARSIGSTNANELSSRSHCLLRVTVKGENLVNGQQTKSHLWLVDLAGSERVGKIEVEGERLKESQFINKSLSALGDVIYALASKSTHIPYRNSKLTHLLQSSLGGDCKTLMFVQISPSSADLGETICSLNFASRVRGIESGPARRQGDLTELLKYKQLAEKQKHDEKETKKLQEKVQSLQLRLAAREHICKSFQEKVRDMENQLTEERRLRIKQETRAFAAASAKPAPVLRTAHKTNTEKKPPLGPPKLRMPLRRITNFLPRETSTKDTTIIPAPTLTTDKENLSRLSKPNSLLKPRRASIAVRERPPPPSLILQPKRRVSIAAFCPEAATAAANPSCMTTPQFNRTETATGGGGGAGRALPFIRDARRARYSRLFSPLPELREGNNGVEAATPVMRTTTTTTTTSGRRFMGSPPPTQGTSSWKPKHPTVIALQRKQLVWSPLKLRGLKNARKLSMPSSRY